MANNNPRKGLSRVTKHEDKLDETNVGIIEVSVVESWIIEVGIIEAKKILVKI